MAGRLARGYWAILIVGLVVLSSGSVGLSVGFRAPTTNSGSPIAPGHAPIGSTTGPEAPPPVQPPTLTPGESAFDARVHETARALATSGLPADRISLPNVGTPARLVDGKVLPRPTLAPGYDSFPEGVAYYGESDPAGTELYTTLNASTVAGSIDVNSLDTAYFDTENPDASGVQLNSILAGVTLQGTTGYNFWTQNALDYYQSNHTLDLGEDTWNFSSPSAYVPFDNSTIASHSPNGSDDEGIYIGAGPYLPAPTPFDLTLYLNSSLTAGGDQKLWYNYSLAAAGEPYRSGNYDWVVFNSTNAMHSGPVAVAPFEASGTSVSPVYSPYDFEIDFGIAGYNGATMDTFAGNVSSTLEYCPVDLTPCTPGKLTSVPAAVDFGSQTGETGEGLAFTYAGTTAYATAGPGIPQVLWGFEGLNGSAPGATSVTNAISVSGEPDPGTAAPYVFVFFDEANSLSPGFVWAPDVPTWHLMPGNYSYMVLLADYEEQTGNLTISAAATALTVDLVFSVASGVYTPLWAFDNAELAGISTGGSGTVGSQYQLFNTPTDDCSNCAQAPTGELSPWFFDFNDYLYPTFPGVFLWGTTAYVEIGHPVPFTVYNESEPTATDFDLQIEFYHTSHVTLSGATGIGTWPTMFAVLMDTLAPAAQNPFPQSNVGVWYSTSDLIRANRFGTEPVPNGSCTGPACGPVYCYYGCVAPDELMLYGGANNTVWGNTFADPADTPLETGGSATYAGLAEAENGDWVYNNNFSVDNPAMLMAYDIYNDSCWAGYAGGCLPLVTTSYSDVWNVTNQSSSDVARTVNGFPLSGNVLGPQYTYQGGNFWWNRGGAENPYATLPFTNVFNYTQNATNLPPGYPAVESSLRVGGDFVPLRWGYFGPPATVSFVESGLPTGTNWSIYFDGSLRNSTASSLTVLDVAPGVYNFTVESVAGYQIPTNTTVNVSGTLTTVDLAYSALNQTVSFSESGLPGGYVWSVTLGGVSLSSIAPLIRFTEPSNSGTYSYVVGVPPGFAAVPDSGNLTVNDTPVQVSVAVSVVPPPPPFANTVTFTEGGLPNGTTWSVTLNGIPEQTVGRSLVFFGLPNGTYDYSIESAAYQATVGITYATATFSSQLAVHGGWVNVTVTFTRQPITVTPAGGYVWLLTAGIVALVVAALIGALLIVRMNARRRRERAEVGAPPPAGGGSPPPPP